MPSTHDQPIDITSRTYQLIYWCHQCHRAVTIASDNPPIICPRCSSHFVYEYDAPMLVVEFTDVLDVGIRPPWRRRRRPRSRSWIVFTPSEGADPNVAPELIEELTQSDLPGPQPAPEYAINELIDVKITQTHLLNDSQSCAVCMDEFNVDGYAKELPCNHIFHSDCIVPWLRLHNSCPVCRKQLPLLTVSTEGTSDSSDGEMDSEIDSRGRRRRWCCLGWRRSQSAVWPLPRRYDQLPAGSHRDSSRMNVIKSHTQELKHVSITHACSDLPLVPVTINVSHIREPICPRQHIHLLFPNKTAPPIVDCSINYAPTPRNQAADCST
ncbi:hypothetical protein QVD17_40530 [Tagetes erecta]|uniref:RING-type E3 ubiquitin transferase n=1 Tax=Tagetes erecta TaxID=13708 RepID=A0AAD8JQ11_TARER|nr:hypothetical protein QVD17_40530 [Tagetes erecta]